MISIGRTAYFHKLKENNADISSIVERFLNVSCKAEFMLLCDLCGYSEKMPPEVFMLVLTRKLSAVSSVEDIDDDDGRSLVQFLDVVHDLATGTGMLDDIIVSRQFINVCGRWMAKGFRWKDKTVFLKLAKILSLSAVKKGL